MTISKSPIIGISKKMERIRQIIDIAADTEASILISGESGTGKTLAAIAITAYNIR